MPVLNMVPLTHVREPCHKSGPWVHCVHTQGATRTSHVCADLVATSPGSQAFGLALKILEPGLGSVCWLLPSPVPPPGRLQNFPEFKSREKDQLVTASTSSRPETEGTPVLPLAALHACVC